MDSAGRPQTRYDGQPAVRHMEYPVLTGLYQYLSMTLAKTYTAVAKATALPGLAGVAEVVMFFNIAAFGLALAWLVTVWATAILAGRRIWDAALVAASPVLIFQAFTNFDALATALAAGGLMAGLRDLQAEHPLIGDVRGRGLMVATEFTGADGQPDAATTAAIGTWLVVNAPVMLLFPRGWSEFFRLNARRDSDMDSLYNVVKSFTGWRGFDSKLGFWQPPIVLNTVVAILFGLCCAAVAYIAWTAPRRPRVAQLAFLLVAMFLVVNKVWSPQFSLWLVPLAVLALPHRRILLAWMTIDALVWVPRMYYLLGPDKKGVTEQWFTATVLLRDLAVVALVVLVIRQIYRPDQDLVRWRGRIDDPCGGVLDRAADAFPPWWPRRLRPAADRLGATDVRGGTHADRDSAVPA